MNRFLLISLLLAAIAYAPAINNGFISDDYVILARAELLKTDPLYLATVPPDNFRLTTQAVFAVLKGLFGYRAPYFYVFGIGLHAINVVLLGRLLQAITEDDFVPRTAALFFAVFQGPHEAIFWITGMSETTLAFFALLTLLMWSRGRYLEAALAFTLALWSKESAVILLAGIVTLEFYQKRRLLNRAYVLLVIPALAFAATFVSTFSRNSMIRSEAYHFGAHALIVVPLTLHRLMTPWLYLILLFLWVQRRRLPTGKALALSLVVLLIPVLPYMFIAYQSSLPSRQLYLVSAVLMTVFATMLKPLQHTKTLAVFILLFVTFNIGYLWLRKDDQFMRRAAPTTRLVETLRHRAPEHTLILNFPSPYGEIAYAAIWAVPGWKPDMVVVDRPEVCDDCRHLRWNPERMDYE